MKLSQLCGHMEFSDKDKNKSDKTLWASHGASQDEQRKLLIESGTVREAVEKLGDEKVVLEVYGKQQEVPFMKETIQQTIDPALDIETICQLFRGIDPEPKEVKSYKKFMNLMGHLHAMRRSFHVAAEIFDKLYEVNMKSFEKAAEENQEAYINFLGTSVPYKNYAAGVNLFKALVKFQFDCTDLSLPTPADPKKVEEWEGLRKGAIIFENKEIPVNMIIGDMEALHSPLDAILRSADTEKSRWSFFSSDDEQDPEKEKLFALKELLINNPLCLAVYDRFNSLALRLDKKIYSRRPEGLVTWQQYFEDTIAALAGIYMVGSKQPRLKTILDELEKVQERKATGFVVGGSITQIIKDKEKMAAKVADDKENIAAKILDGMADDIQVQGAEVIETNVQYKDTRAAANQVSENSGFIPTLAGMPVPQYKLISRLLESIYKRSESVDGIVDEDEGEVNLKDAAKDLEDLTRYVHCAIEPGAEENKNGEFKPMDYGKLGEGLKKAHEYCQDRCVASAVTTIINMLTSRAKEKTRYDVQMYLEATELLERAQNLKKKEIDSEVTRIFGLGNEIEKTQYWNTFRPEFESLAIKVMNTLQELRKKDTESVSVATLLNLRTYSLGYTAPSS